MKPRRTPPIRRFVDPRKVRFVLVGLANTLTDVLVFAALVQLGSALAVANVAGYCAGACLSFAANRSWTFGDARGGGRQGRQMVRFAILSGAALTVSTASVVALAAVLPVATAKAASVVLVAVMSYAGMRFFVFPAGAGAGAASRTPQP